MQYQPNTAYFERVTIERAFQSLEAFEEAQKKVPDFYIEE